MFGSRNRARMGIQGWGGGGGPRSGHLEGRAWPVDRSIEDLFPCQTHNRLGSRKFSQVLTLTGFGIL